MEDAFLSNWLQVNDHQGNKGLKVSWGDVCLCLCAHRSECVFVLQAEYEGWKYGRKGGGSWLMAVVWLEASPALHRDPF